jgi:flagellar assembly protein FliH
LSDPARHLLRDARRSGTIALDFEGRIAPGAIANAFDRAEAESTAEAADIVTVAHDQADRLVREAAEAATAIRHEAYADGRELGHRDGVAIARAELADELALLQRALGESKVIRDRLLWAAEHEIIELVLAAARTVVGEHARLDPALTVDVVERALQRAGSQNVVSIRVHPDRRESVAARIAELRSTPVEFEVRGDGSVEVGGCVIDTRAGQIDARLDVQLDEVARALRKALPDTQPPIDERVAA